MGPLLSGHSTQVANAEKGRKTGEQIPKRHQNRPRSDHTTVRRTVRASHESTSHLRDPSGQLHKQETESRRSTEKSTKFMHVCNLISTNGPIAFWALHTSSQWREGSQDTETDPKKAPKQTTIKSHNCQTHCTGEP